MKLEWQQDAASTATKSFQSRHEIISLKTTRFALRTKSSKNLRSITGNLVDFRRRLQGWQQRMKQLTLGSLNVELLLPFRGNTVVRTASKFREYCLSSSSYRGNSKWFYRSQVADSKAESVTPLLPVPLQEPWTNNQKNTATLSSDRNPIFNRKDRYID